MGAPTDEIGRQIAETREHVDENLTILEKRAAANARRVAIIVAAGVAAGLVVGGGAFLIYRHMRKPGMSERLHDMIPDALTDLPETIRTRFKGRPVKVVISSGEDRESVWESIARKVAPAVATTMVGAVTARIVRQRGARESAD
ncbi:MAG: hypothetical protein E6I42_06045 [Chloroflexi bacterium]|nr:MAG: hypothetical protein E6I77_06025 [Chloroflexota bacterium]TMF04384.1 MAG: hypothetical protein E6I42_06045 [Chloroflexota bacterium]